MSRSIARENAFRTIYAKLFDETFDGLEASDDLKNFNQEFYNDIITNFEQHFEQIKSKVKNNLKGVTLDRIYKVDLALIYLSMIELEFLKTPSKVVVNEVVNLAKQYSTDKSHKFINGFLAGIINGNE